MLIGWLVEYLFTHEYLFCIFVFFNHNLITKLLDMLIAILLGALGLLQPDPRPKYNLTHAYFLGCGNQDLISCQKNILDSPFEKIIYSFVNGRPTGLWPNGSKWNHTGHIWNKTGLVPGINPFVDPFDLAFVQGNTFGTDRQWRVRGLNAAFAGELRKKKKKLLISLGGGDTAQKVSGVAVGRLFTHLWLLQKLDNTALHRWVKAVSAFVLGGNPYGVTFDGVDIDNEEGHSPGDPGGCGLDNWKCPYGKEVHWQRGRCCYI